MLKQLSKIEYRISNLVREVFNRNNINVYLNAKTIVIWYGVTRRPPAFGSVLTEWVPFSGGPIYGESALDACYCLKKHICEYKQLLPKRLRDFDVIVERG